MRRTRVIVEELPENAQVCLYGAGEFGANVLNEILRLRPDVRVNGFFDSTRQGGFHGLAIHRPETRYLPPNTLILICSSHHEEISRILDQHGYAEQCVMDQARYLPPKYLSQTDLDILQAVRPFTMTSVNRVQSLLGAVEYIVHHGIAGSVVECGVWAGGSVMAAALKLKALGDVDRNLYLYDTFEGMTPPTAEDVNNSGEEALEIFAQVADRGEGKDWCYSDLASVQRNVFSTGYPRERFTFVRGDVCLTLPATLPDKIALLRLDTDWYESTAREMEHLFPKLLRHGILILDDYNHWKGSQRAVDEYFAKHSIRMFLQRIDDSAVMGVKLTD
ncbi:MAG: TylF/MycF/NovP-related O-methyltransferase [Desulfovibrio sp.]